MTTLRFVDVGTTDPVTSQAIYHGLAESMDEDSDPIIDLVRPDFQYVCIGAHQELEKEVDLEAAEAAGLPVYRRKVGGGTVLLDSGQIFVHLVSPRSALPSGSVEDLFEWYVEPLVDTYRELGLEATFKPVNDVIAGRRKIGGTGAGEIGDAVVLVGSFMLDFDVETMAEVVSAPSEKFADKMLETLESNMTWMARELETVPDEETIVETYRETVADRFGWEVVDSELTEAEWDHVETAREQLQDPDWLERKGLETGTDRTKVKGGTHVGEGRHKAEGGLLRATVVEEEGTIADLVISGDVQVLPQAGLEDLATDLVGESIEDGSLEPAVADAIDRHDVALPGVTAADVATAIEAAREG